MKTRLFILLALAFSFSNCSTNTEFDVDHISGNYRGVFERNGVTSTVEIRFIDGTFLGESEIEKFPAICNGVYSTAENRITFTNNCVWTADFDWSLILSGEWTFSRNRSELILFKSNGDKYTLIRQ
jgi:hypothetical protein